jgi:predicted nucleic acid-binding protein
VRFWDSSALIPLLIAEPTSVFVTHWLAIDPVIVVVWALTRIEMLSALERRRRDGPVSKTQIVSAHRRLDQLCRFWNVVSDIERVGRQAERLLQAYSLRAADSLQLGAAIVAAEGNPTALDFVTFDRRLADAANREGFKVLTG